MTSSSGNSYDNPDPITLQEDARLAVSGLLYHPEINGTIRMVEDTIEFVFPGLMNLVTRMYPEYNAFVHGEYNPVGCIHKAIESSILEECSNLDPKKSLLWIPR